nr:MAG TPA: Colipase [Caudoviricetes sp.]
MWETGSMLPNEIVYYRCPCDVSVAETGWAAQ